MKAVLELHFDDTVPAEYVSDIVGKAMSAIRGGDGPMVHPRLLVELSPNYLELPISYLVEPIGKPSKTMGGDAHSHGH